MSFVAGAVVKLRDGAPKVYQNARGFSGVVQSVYGDARILLATVAFDRGDILTNLIVKDIPVSYLVPAAREGSSRRGVLNLHAPKDTRTEKEKQDEAEAWLRSHGYEVLGIGQYKRQAVCWTCTRANRRENPNARPVSVFCKGCGSPGFAGDSGNSEGVADWQVRHPVRWVRRAVFDIEWKRDAKSTRRAKQIELEQKGWHVIVDSLPACAKAIGEFERDVLGIDPHPVLEEYL